MGKISKDLTSRKRRHSDVCNVDLDSQLSSDSPAITKRVRQSANAITPASPISQATKTTMDSDQKTALLGLIRQRLAELDSRTIYVRRLPRNTTLEQLKKMCPTSINARIQSTKFANRRKHAFIEFKSRDLAKVALKAISGKLLADHPIRAELCSERMRAPETDGASNQPPTPHWTPPHQRKLSEFSLIALHITCIPRSASQDDVRALFTKAVSFDFHMNPKNKGIGSCRIVFPSEADALEAFHTKHGALVRDCPLVVNFAFKKRKPREKKPDLTCSQTTGSPSKRIKSNSGESGPLKSQKRQASSPLVGSLPGTAKGDQGKKGKKVKTIPPVVEPPIVPLYHAPLGSNTLKESKQSKSPKTTALRTAPIPKKLQRSGKADRLGS